MQREMTTPVLNLDSRRRMPPRYRGGDQIPNSIGVEISPNGFGVPVERHMDVLVGNRALCFCLIGEGAPIAFDEFGVVGERSQQRPRMEFVDSHDVDFRAHDDRGCSEEQEGQQTQNDGKDAIGGGGTPHHRGHIEGTEGLKCWPGEQQRRSLQVADRHRERRRGGEPESDDEDARIQDDYRKGQQEAERTAQMKRTAVDVETAVVPKIETDPSR